MASNYEKFWELGSFALMGHNANRNFPALTFQGLLNQGKTVYPVDASLDDFEGHKVYNNLDNLAGPVEGIIVEVPKDETAAMVKEVAKTEVKHLWIHLGADTTEAIDIAEKAEINVRCGTCAVMYVNGTGLHKFHGWINKLFKKY